MGYPWGYSASPRNTLGISHTPQLPWGLSITCRPKPFRCMPRFPLITRVSYATTVCVLLPPDNQQSPCSADPLWKQKFDIGCTIYRRVVIPNPAVLEYKKSASKAPFCLIFYKFLYDNHHINALVNQTTNLELGKQVWQRRLPVAKDSTKIFLR